MTRKHAIAALALLGLLTAPAFATGTSAGALGAGTSAVRLAGLAPRVPAGAARLGSVPADQQLTITIALRPTHADRLSSLLRDLYDPASTRYQQWLQPGEFNREFGPSPAQIDTVTSWLHQQGLRDTSVQGLAVHASGDAQSVSHALGVTFTRYQLDRTTTGYVASSAPLVPSAVAGDITSIVGLSDTVRLHNSLDVARPGSTRGVRAAEVSRPAVATPAAATGCAAARNFAGSRYWTPAQISSFYGIDNLTSAGLTGKGKSIALVEFAPSVATDTATFFSCFGLHNKVSVVPVDGGAELDPSGTVEADVDIQEAAAQAPGATILSYEAPNIGSAEYDVYNAIVSQDKAQVVSTSWGDCESDVASGGSFINALETVLQQAAAQGQSVFAASGDTGSEACYDGSPATESLDVDHPASDPFVTAVGGTSLMQAGKEPVWNECEGAIGTSCAESGGDAGGSGLSHHFKRPSWQPLAANATCTTCREVPDLSVNAGVDETFYVNGWLAVRGTSIAAPTLAGIAADIAQGSKAGKLGDFAPALSALAAQHVYGSALTDVKTGFNRTTLAVESPGSTDLTRTHAGEFRTSAGFDLATGFGTPLAGGLASPQVSAMTPSQGKVGTRVTLHGLGLEKATIRFGSKIATVVSANAKSAVVVVPKGSGKVNVTGTDAFGTGNRPAAFTYRNK
jgi:subtilase family serine protease